MWSRRSLQALNGFLLLSKENIKISAEPLQNQEKIQEECLNVFLVSSDCLKQGQGMKNQFRPFNPMHIIILLMQYHELFYLFHSKI